MDLNFSIVIPNYNSGKVIDRAIRSLISQDYPNLQIIVADAESDDESRDIIEHYRSHFHTVIIEKDKGQADGLNKGFAHASGDIFGWLCADDVLMPDTLFHVSEIFSKKPEIDIVTGSCERIFEDGTSCITHPRQNALRIVGVQNMIEQPSTFWRASLHHRTGLLDLSYNLGFDWDFWARMYKLGAKLETTERVLSRYYFSGDNKCSVAGNLFQQESFRHIRKHGPLFGSLAYIYRFIYFQFDLKGCLDRPLQCSFLRYYAYRITRLILRATIGSRLLNMYNWHFASCQQRNLKWY